eukprot:SAG22_NODE_88_length_21409_cov_11.207180_17_plen_177_part_00
MEWTAGSKPAQTVEIGRSSSLQVVPRALAGGRMTAHTAASPDLGWMDTTDGFGGFKVMHHFKNVALAVSKSNKLEVGKVYGAPAGWHWASRAEVEAIMGGGTAARNPKKKYYYDQGGWKKFTWGRVDRTFFVFRDSLVVGGCITANGKEGQVGGRVPPRDCTTDAFAGIVCVKDPD